MFYFVFFSFFLDVTVLFQSQHLLMDVVIQSGENFFFVKNVLFVMSYELPLGPKISVHFGTEGVLRVKST